MSFGLMDIYPGMRERGIVVHGLECLVRIPIFP